MKKLVLLAGLVLAGLVGSASTASAATACYIVSVTVNGEPVVDQSGCQTAP